MTIIPQTVLIICHTVHTVVSLPVVFTHPSAAIVGIFQSAVFKCSFQSFGYMKVVWKKDGHSLPAKATDTITRSKNIVTSRLQINRAVGYYSGKYYCVAENIAGQVASLAADHVQGRYKHCMIFIVNLIYK